ncbi:MAG TPA: PAS domain S-box protein [Candidatus Polarisedimenticolia bacterium]|nr:PAS domain S-box protein [Candidatus Polarisedimenticolia bacterium]
MSARDGLTVLVPAAAFLLDAFLAGGAAVTALYIPAALALAWSRRSWLLPVVAAAAALSAAGSVLPSLPASPAAELSERAIVLSAMAAALAVAVHRPPHLAADGFRLLSESGVLGIAAWDAAGRIHWANDAFLRCIGFTLEDVRAGRVRWDRLTPPEWMPRTEQAVREMRERGSCQPYEKEYFRRDGSRFWGLFAGMMPEGASRGVAIMIDITARKEAERRLRELNESLEQRVTERTREAERRADQARAMARELAQAEQRERRRLSRLLHDHLQQDLVAARMHAGTLKAQPGGEAARAALRRLEERLQDSIQASRTLSVELDPPILNSHGMVSALEWLGRWMQERHELEVEISADPGCEKVSEEAKFFAFQAARELLLNVVKHAGVRRARVAAGPCGDGKIHIAVEDDGAGFDPACLSSDGIGGMGLAGIRERVESLGGSLRIDSAPGRGARFRLMLPQSLAAAEAGRASGEE